MRRPLFTAALSVAFALAASSTVASTALAQPAPRAATTQAAVTAAAAGDGVEAGPGERTGRLRGSDRYATAVAISRHAFPDGAPVVHLARGDVYVDALAGGVLTAGPILLVPTSGKAPQSVLDEVDRLGATRVIVLGGTAAVSDAMMTAVARGRQTARLRGPDRYATAAAISRHQFRDGAIRANIAVSDVEALAAGNVDEPVLLVSPKMTRLPSAVVDEILRLEAFEVRLIIWDDHIASLFNDDERFADQGIYVTGFYDESIESVTAQLAFEAYGGVDLPVVHLARLDNPVDAIAGGALTTGPVLLVPPCRVSRLSEFNLDVFDPERVIALGGAAAICDDALAAYGRHAREPFPAPGFAGWRTLPKRTPVGARDFHVQVDAWSDDGSIAVLFENWLGADDQFHTAQAIWTLGTGQVRDLAPPPSVTSWDETYATFAIAPDNTRIWMSLDVQAADAPPHTEIWEHTLATSASRRIDDNRATWLHGRALRTRQDTSPTAFTERVTPLAGGAPWSWNQDTRWVKDGFQDVRLGTDGQWLTVGRFGDPGGPHEEYRLIRPDGSSQTLLAPSNSTCGPVLWFISGISDDANRLLVIRTRYERFDDGSSCAFGGNPISELLLVDRTTGITVPVASRDGVAIEASAELSADGELVMVAPFLANPLPDEFFHLALQPDVAPFDGAKATDGDRGGAYLASAKDILAGNAVWEDLPWSRDTPHAYAYFPSGRNIQLFSNGADGLSTTRIRRG